jgi:hypothetical protein
LAWKEVAEEAAELSQSELEVVKNAAKANAPVAATVRALETDAVGVMIISVLAEESSARATPIRKTQVRRSRTSAAQVAAAAEVVLGVVLS